jgi:hypothetical protein
MSEAQLHKGDLQFFGVPKGKLAEIVDHAVMQGLPLSKLTLDHYQEIAANLGIPSYFGGLFEFLRSTR